MICSIAIWAYRLKQWPIEGATTEDLQEAKDFAQDCLNQGMTHFPADSDVGLAEFINWPPHSLGDE